MFPCQVQGWRLKLTNPPHRPRPITQQDKPTSKALSYRAYSSRALEVAVFWKRELLSWKNLSYFSEFRLG